MTSASVVQLVCWHICNTLAAVPRAAGVQMADVGDRLQ